MNKSRLVEERKAIEELLRKDTDQGCAQSAELILLDKLVQVNAQELKNQAKMLAVNKSILEAQKMVVVVLVEFCVELHAVISLRRRACPSESRQHTRSRTDTSIIL